MSPGLRRARLDARWRPRETANLRDAHKRGYWYRRQSSAPALVSEIAHAFPGSMTKVGLQALSLEAGAAKLERRTLLSLGDHAMQPTFDYRPKRNTLACRQLASFAQQWIGDFHGCLHKIPSRWDIKYGHPYLADKGWRSN